jgi:hypothetical protein
MPVALLVLPVEDSNFEPSERLDKVVSVNDMGSNTELYYYN